MFKSLEDDRKTLSNKEVIVINENGEKFKRLGVKEFDTSRARGKGIKKR